MIRWYTRPSDAGQTVTREYAYGGDGTAYRRTTDRSDGTVTVEVGDLDWSREPEGEQGPDHIPCVEEWTVLSGGAS